MVETTLAQPCIRIVCMSISRRTILRSAAAGFPLAAALTAAQGRGSESQRLKIVFTGGHPGDPECGCGGTIARYTDLGHEVVLLYMNRGEAFCEGAGSRDCGVVRTAEAEKACQILKARAAFAGQHDAHSIVDNQHYESFRQQFEAEKADMVFTHWPIDQHRDHRAISMLVLDSWLGSGKKAALYFYEVTGDTMMFSPAEFVDIAAVEPRKQAACFAHASQVPEKWYTEQEALGRRRGAESGRQQAEAFVRHWDSTRALLP
jgi:N-acetylglucosamine malate deacetylase 1